MLPLAFKDPSILSTESFTNLLAAEGKEAVRRRPSWPWGLNPGEACEDVPLAVAAELGDVGGEDFEVGACEQSVSPPLLKDPLLKSS